MKRQPNLKALQLPAAKGGEPAKQGDVNLRNLSRATAYKLRGKGGPAGKGGK